MNKVSLLGLDPTPSIIYLYSLSNSEFITALGFTGHKQAVVITAEDTTPFFTACSGCSYNRIYQNTGNTVLGCPGGYEYLVANQYQDYSTLPTGVRVPIQEHKCRLTQASQLDYKRISDLSFVVNFPDYILLNNFYSGTAGPRAYNLRAFLPYPEAQSLADLEKGIPFLFGNVSGDTGNVCLGRDVNTSVDWSSWKTIQMAFFSYGRNYEWTGWWKGKDGLETLLQYAEALNQQGAALVNKYSWSRWQNWNRQFVSTQEYSAIRSRIIVPFNSNISNICFNNGTFSFELLDGSFVDTNMQPIGVEESETN